MMSQGDIYGEESTFGGKPVEVSVEKKEESKETYPLRIYFTGGSVDILSPLPKEKFLVDLISEITANSSDPNWSGWFGFRVIPTKKTDKKNRTVSVMVRQIVGVEEL
jgi:hypothetical protein|tara:strand:- start:461 stop:781 length:321 start_codon:yes stop_codon:yes gene_type:complete